MKTAIRARYDGKVFVPDEPVDLPEGEEVLIQVLAPVRSSLGSRTPEQVEQVLDELRATAVRGVNIPEDALRRENLYHNRGS